MFPENGVLRNFVDRGLNLPKTRLSGNYSLIGKFKRVDQD
jgi:hypothetical protein